MGGLLHSVEIGEHAVAVAEISMNGLNKHNYKIEILQEFWNTRSKGVKGKEIYILRFQRWRSSG